MVSSRLTCYRSWLESYTGIGEPEVWIQTSPNFFRFQVSFARCLSCVFIATIIFTFRFTVIYKLKHKFPKLLAIFFFCTWAAENIFIYWQVAYWYLKTAPKTRMQDDTEATKLQLKIKILDIKNNILSKRRTGATLSEFIFLVRINTQILLPVFLRWL